MASLFRLLFVRPRAFAPRFFIFLRTGLLPLIILVLNPHILRAEKPSCNLSPLLAHVISLRAGGDIQDGSPHDSARQRRTVAEELERCARLGSDAPLVEQAFLNATILWDDIHRMTADAGAAAKVRFLVREVEERYRNSSSLAAVKLILAQVEWRLGNEKRAQEIAREVENLFPRSEHARTARSFEKSFARPYQSVMPLGGGDRSKRKQVVVLDPGHGGEDRGAVGPRGRTEKEVVLLIAKRAAALIEQRGNFSVFLTRESDVALPLSERTRLANERGAVLFVSLHTNASTDHRPRGLATYYLDNADDAASRALAERENALVSLAGNREDSDLALMLSSLVQASKMEDSVVLAHSVHQSINRSVRAPNRWQGSGLRDLGVKKAPFFVLVGAHMPCVLLELFFIDNRDDAALLAEEQFREMIARGIADGIEDFSRATSHTQ